MKDKLELILKELDESLYQVSDKQYEDLLDKLTSSKRVIVVGVGRVLISLKAWVKRMKHLEIDINYLGNEVEEPVGEGDLVIVASSSGESLICKAMAQKAKDLDAKVFYIGCTLESSVSNLSDYKLIMAGRTKFAHADEYQSQQPMSTLFEQQLYLLGDCLTLDIMERRGFAEAVVKARHANLE